MQTVFHNFTNACWYSITSFSGLFAEVYQATLHTFRKWKATYELEKKDLGVKRCQRCSALREMISVFYERCMMICQNTQLPPKVQLILMDMYTGFAAILGTVLFTKGLNPGFVQEKMKWMGKSSILAYAVYILRFLCTALFFQTSICIKFQKCLFFSFFNQYSVLHLWTQHSIIRSYLAGSAGRNTL